MRAVAERGLYDLAPDDVLREITTDGARPEWAAQITSLGRTVLPYQVLQRNPDPVVEPAPTPAAIKAHGIDIPRAALAAPRPAH
ncbi:hypothetical protein [Kitasatospora purpeofusca]|uniref:hypothetical protein n=1 Tax=Kitasatospora purpeofusca TaxID=67352 RepID=UPI00225ADB8B|nr:hypothetical protein [Kitasatospora purpeofusca]MCX4690677.1 hypothetical protein [Kitasatospora purpeofusca]